MDFWANAICTLLCSSFFTQHNSVVYSFLFDEQYSTVRIYHKLFTHSPTDEHLDSFQIWAIMSEATTHIYVQISVRHVFSFLLGKQLGGQLLGLV